MYVKIHYHVPIQIRFWIPKIGEINVLFLFNTYNISFSIYIHFYILYDYFFNHDYDL